MKVNHLNHQLTGRLHVPSSDTVSLGGVGPEHAQANLLKRRKVGRFEERHVVHLFENLMPHAVEDDPLVAVRLGQPHPSRPTMVGRMTFFHGDKETAACGAHLAFGFKG